MKYLMFGVAGVFVLASNICAQEESSERPAPSAFQFNTGSWGVSVIGGAYRESFGGNDEVLYFGGLDIEYFAWDRIAIATELVGYHAEQEDPDAAAFGLSIGPRWYFCQPMKNLALFVEGSVGIVEADHRLPSPDGSHHNFTASGGIGLRCKLMERVDLLLGGRYFHLSNANMHGEERNPSIDAFGGFGGLSITF